jgi:hypothetical protein
VILVGIFALDMTSTNQRLMMKGVDPIRAVIGQDVLRYHQAVIDYATLALFLKRNLSNYALKRTVREEVSGAIMRCGPHGPKVLRRIHWHLHLRQVVFGGLAGNAQGGIFSGRSVLVGEPANRKETTMKPLTCTLLLLLLAAAGGAAEFASVPTISSDPGFQLFLTEASAPSEAGLGISIDSHGRMNLATNCTQTNLCARVNCQCSETCSGSVATYPCVLTPQPHFDQCRCG